MRTRRLVLKERDWAEASGFADERGWPELVPVLEAMAEHDVDDRVRAEARKIVSVCRAVLG
jgi:hypothetical protein